LLVHVCLLLLLFFLSGLCLFVMLASLLNVPVVLSSSCFCLSLLIFDALRTYSDLSIGLLFVFFVLGLLPLPDHLLIPS